MGGVNGLLGVSHALKRLQWCAFCGAGGGQLHGPGRRCGGVLRRLMAGEERDIAKLFTIGVTLANLNLL